MNAPSLPHLPTLECKPSWVNRAGRIDRSACAELRASEARRLIEPDHWRHTHSEFDLQAFATVTITARRLFELHDSRMTRPLIGDHRTSKSNALKHATTSHTPTSRRTARDPNPKLRDLSKIFSRKPDRGYDTRGPFIANPNKGLSRTKRLALWSGKEYSYQHLGEWTQAIRIERWSRRKKSEGRDQKSEVRSQRSGGRHFVPQLARRGGCHSLPAVAGAAACPPRRVPFYEHFLLCPHCSTKRKKLFLPMAHVQEIDDAEIAEGWIKLIDAHPHFRRRLLLDSALSTQHSALVERYAPLFRRDRRLLCADCLGLRWGEVKKHRRPHVLTVPAIRRLRRRRPASAQ